MMNILEEVKKVIEDNYEEGKHGLFFSRNTVGDWMSLIYENGDVLVYICYSWSYFEVFGLTDDEQQELIKFYEKLEKKKK